MPDLKLEADNLHVWRGDRHVLRGVSFTLAPGEALQLSGANGAGKTTLLRTLAALRPPEEGAVRWAGRDVRRDLSAYHAALSYVGHEPALKPDLTVLENLRYSVGIRRTASRGQLLSALESLGQPDWHDRPVRALSAGQRRRVGLCALLLIKAPLWLLDEPTTNLDVHGQRLVAALIDQQLAGGGIVVAAVHHELGMSAPGLRRLTLEAGTEHGFEAHD